MFKFFIIILFVSNVYLYKIKNFGLTKSELKNKPKSLIKLNTSLGEIIGYKQIVQNKTINIFYGVPYAEKAKRFKKPNPIKKFPTDPYLALDFKPHCFSVISPHYHPNDKFSDDCLYANIFSPNLESIKSPNGICSKKFPVMIFFMAAMNSAYKMSPLLNSKNESTFVFNGELFAALHDTILITFNTRRNLFAFLTVESIYPGNLALFDSEQVLQWTSKYIEQFCGDSKSLTTFSHSVGSLTLFFLLINENNRNLIKNAILQSPSLSNYFDKFPREKDEVLLNSFESIHLLGCLNLSIEFDNLESLDYRIEYKYFNKKNNAFYLNKDKFFTDLKKNYEIAILKYQSDSLNYLNFNYIDKDLIKLIKFLSKYVDLECLENLDANKIRALPYHYYNHDWYYYYDNDFISKESYLNFKLFNKINANNQLNLLIGVTENEDVSIFNYFLNQTKYYMDQFNVPQLSKDEAKEMIKKKALVPNEFKETVANLYTDLKWNLERGYFDSVLNAELDKYFCSTIYLSHQFALTTNSVQSYFISQQSTKHYSTTLVGLDQNNFAWIGSAHGDELTYLFGLPIRVPNQFTDLDREFSLKLLKYWTTFAREGKMTNLVDGSNWPQSNLHKPKPRFVEINNNFLRERKFEFEERCEILEQLKIKITNKIKN